MVTINIVYLIHFYFYFIFCELKGENDSARLIENGHPKHRVLPEVLRSRKTPRSYVISADVNEFSVLPNPRSRGNEKIEPHSFLTNL